LSRNRYWGTPLPIWRCEDDHLTCVGSLAELSRLTGTDQSGLDPHRPYVDDVVLTCGQCGAESRRVSEVIDVWFDSGAMPFAQWGAPHRNAAEFEASFPAQYICEAVDQTRGWFYSLMAVSTLLFDRSSYETVLCLGLILDDDGRKMSKHYGNVLDPFEVFERHGADAVRWLMLASGSPWLDRRVGPASLDDIVRKVLLTVWHTASFLTLYANASGWTPGSAPVERTLLDRWMLAELNATVHEVDAALEAFDSATAGRRLSTFIEGLSNWYVRCSRRRFWNGDPAALATLHECLHTLVRLLAPFVPFLADHLWDQLCVSVDPTEVDSVHLATWPVADPALVDETLFAQMALVRQIVELGRSARATSRVRTRQPLARAVVVASGFGELPEELLTQIADELNVLTVAPAATDLVEVTVKPNFRALGRRFGKRTPAVAAAVATAGEPVDGSLVVDVDGEAITLSGAELIITETPRAGWTVATDGALSVALDTELTDELRAAGLVRDALRFIQESRKLARFDVTDRVALWWSSPDDTVAAALRAETDLVAREVLAVSMTEGTPPEALTPYVFDDLKLTIWLRRSTGV
jgi:isoleucyl-tRNA synthetase